MVKIEINGQPIQADDGAMIIEAADAAGIPIPRFCYHKKLSIAANCRMCLVEVEKAAKPLPACATPVTEGMRIHTQSKKALSAQKGVMEFLLINHPLDCPICDQGGECDLQDLALGYGKDVSRYQEGKRVVKDKNLGPLISTEMTRCIHCTRCVRFGEEIAGIKELGATGRGEHMRIGTYIERSVDSELSGNMIDLCPVGALTSKPYRFTARSWELQVLPSIAPHDMVGSNLLVQIRRNEVMRVLPKENEAINETWLSNRDRFSYLALSHPERVLTPKIKKDGQWKQVDWNTALNYGINRLQRIITESGAQHAGALISPSRTLQELYLTQRLMRRLGSHNIDHRVHMCDFRNSAEQAFFPGLSQSIASLQNLDVGLIIGANIRKEQPLIAHRLRKSALNGAHFFELNGMDYATHYPVVEKIVVPPQQWVKNLFAIALAVAQQTNTAFPEKLIFGKDKATVTPLHQKIAASLISGGQAAVIMGSVAMMHPDFSLLERLALFIAQSTKANYNVLTHGANSAGAWISGAVPHREAGGIAVTNPGLDAAKMLENNLKALLMVGLDAELDTINPDLTLKALHQAEMVICLSEFANETQLKYADVILPITPFTETPGTFINGEGCWQDFNAVVTPLGDSRPGWKVLRVMGNLLDLPGFDYISAEQIKAEIQQLSQDVANVYQPWRTLLKPVFHPKNDVLVRLPHTPGYSIDSLCRRSGALQDSEHISRDQVSLHPETAKQYELEAGDEIDLLQGEQQQTYQLNIDKRVAQACVLVPMYTRFVLSLGGAFGEVKILKKSRQSVVNE